MSRSIGAARRPGRVKIAWAGVLLLASTFVVGVPTPPRAGAAARKTVIVYGDSVVYESSHEIATAFAATKQWSYHARAYVALAPCDYLPMLRTDLAALHPAVVVIQTMGNDLSGCMTRVTTERGSPAYFAKYRADLHALFRDASRAGAKVWFIQPLPVLAAGFNAALQRIGAIAKTEAAKFEGVKVAAGPRNAVTDCPIRLVDGCAVYSSGAVRFAAALVETVAEK